MPTGEQCSADLPILRPEIKGAIESTEGYVIRDVGGIERLQIEQPDIRVHPAAVTFPRSEIHADRDVGKQRSIR